MYGMCICGKECSISKSEDSGLGVRIMRVDLSSWRRWLGSVGGDDG